MEPVVSEELTGTKLKIAEAALQTLKTKGYAGASAREIAAAGNFNQALIFYHFGSIEKLLLASLEMVSARRMRAYSDAFERAQTIPELASLAREIQAEDLENDYVKVLGEMVAGGVSNPELGAGVAGCMEPWIEMVERKLRALLAGSVLEGFVPSRDVAYAVVALYLGIDMLGHLDGDHARAQSLLDLGARYAPLIGVLLWQRSAGSL